MSGDSLGAGESCESGRDSNSAYSKWLYSHCAQGTAFRVGVPPMASIR